MTFEPVQNQFYLSILLVDGLDRERLFILVVLVVDKYEYVDVPGSHRRSESQADVRLLGPAEVEFLFFELDEILAARSNVEDLARRVRVGEGYLLVAALAAPDGQDQLERFVDDRLPTYDVDEPASDQLVELEVDDVDVHVHDAVFVRTNPDVDLLQTVCRQHERVFRLDLHLSLVRREALYQP